MSCNRPNVYGAVNPYGIYRGGLGMLGSGGGYGCVGYGNTDIDYAMGYGVGPGHVIPKYGTYSVASDRDPDSEVAIGSYYWDQVDHEKAQKNSENTKLKIEVGLMLAALVLFIIIIIAVSLKGGNVGFT